MFNPIGILFSGLLIGYLTQSGFLLQQFRFAPQIIDIIVAVIIYFSALALLLKGFFQLFMSQKREEPPKSAGEGPDPGGTIAPTEGGDV